MSKDPVEYLRHMKEECRFLLSVGGPMLPKEKFLQDETLKRAVVRSLEIIGEAAKKVPVDFREKWPLIQWRNMAGMRDRLIHKYMGVNYTLVWDVLQNKIPELDAHLSTVLQSE